MSDIDLAEILRFLNSKRVRASYGAVAGIVGGNAQSIGGRLGARRGEASWVVDMSTGTPTGYTQDQLHPELTSSAEIIRTGEALKRRLLLWKASQSN